MFRAVRKIVPVMLSLPILATVYSAHASYDFSDYELTLDEFYDEGMASISSGYNMNVTKYTGPVDGAIVGYEFAGGAINPIYYVYDYNVKPSASSLSRMRNGSKQNITGYFIGRSTNNTGGAIEQRSGAGYGDIVGDFIGNYASGYSSGAYGGAIWMGSGKIESITGDFIDNFAMSSAGAGLPNGYGGAIEMQGGIHSTIGTINGNFIGNYVKGHRYMFGGAIFTNGSIDVINGNFIDNKVIGLGAISASGGAIFTTAYDGGTGVAKPIIGEINGSFIANGVINTEGSGHSTARTGSGGAINNGGRIGAINGDFIGNYVLVGGNGYGGAISNGNYIESIKGDFIGNYVSSTNGHAYGGGMYTSKQLENYFEGNFLGNYVETDSTTALALGGAIYSRSGNLAISADGVDRFFVGNYTRDNRGTINNAIFVDTEGTSDRTITFSLLNDATLSFFDNIMGAKNVDGTSLDYASQYNVTFKGDGSDTYTLLKNEIINAGIIDIEDTTLALREGDNGIKANFIANPDDDMAPAVTAVMLNNGSLHTANGYMDELFLDGWSSTGDSFWHLDVNPDTMTADKISVNGNVEGVTNLVVYASSGTDITGRGEILFAESFGDLTGNEDSFSIFRVYASPYLYDIVYNTTGDGNDRTWAFSMNGDENPDKDTEVPNIPDPDKPEVITGGTGTTPNVPNKPQPKPDLSPEVVAYTGLHAAAVEQTKGLLNNLRDKSGFGSKHQDDCGGRNDLKTSHNLWVNPVYINSNIEKPVDIEADVWGMEAGGDKMIDKYNRLGVFASFRKGTYDMNGKGDAVSSTIGSKTHITSYLGGLYYRNDYKTSWILAYLFGGLQKADIKTNDGVRANTNGTQYGGAFEIGEVFNVTYNTLLEPSFRIYHTQIKFGNVYDAYGKVGKYQTLAYTELELGARLDRKFDTNYGVARVYIRPSIIRNFAGGNNVVITDLNKLSTYDDGMLGRVEIGGEWAFNDSFSTQGFINYTFGSNYYATGVGVELNYAW